MRGFRKRARERRLRAIGQRRMTSAGASQRVDPQRLNFHRLADARRDHAAVDARIHPRELHAGDAAREQAVVVHPDAEARARPRSRRGSRTWQPSAARALTRPAAPRRGIRGRRSTNHNDASTELNSGAPPWSGKRLGSMPSDTVSAHASRIDRGDVVAPAREHQSAHGDERVAAPVGEPRKAGDDRVAAVAADDERFGGAIERRQCPAPAGLPILHSRGRSALRRRRDVRPRATPSTASRCDRSKVNVPGAPRSSMWSSPRAASSR